MSSLLRSLAAFAATSLLFGCPPHGGPTADAGGGSGADVYSAGMEKAGELGHFSVQLVDAEPAPPDRGDNLWRLAVHDAEGALVAGADVELRPFMPQHGHGTTPLNFLATAEGNGNGTYIAGPFDLFMPGLWEITVTVTASDGTEDHVVFAFDIEG